MFSICVVSIYFGILWGSSRHYLRVGGGGFLFQNLSSNSKVEDIFSVFFFFFGSGVEEENHIAVDK